MSMRSYIHSSIDKIETIERLRDDLGCPLFRFDATTRCAADRAKLTITGIDVGDWLRSLTHTQADALIAALEHALERSRVMRRDRRAWTAADDAAVRTMHEAGALIGEIARRLDRGRSVVRRRAERMGIVLAASWTRREYSDADLDYLRAQYPDTPTIEIARALNRPLQHVYAAATRLGLSKSAAYLASPHACRLRRGDNVGAENRYKKGHAPANKGLRRPGYAPGRMAETQFKKGERSGVASRLYKPIGSTRTVDGYLYRKVSDIPGPWTINWRPVHILMWEQTNGPIPPKHALIFVDGDRTNIAMGNLQLVSRRDLMLRNTIHHLPPELVEVVMLKGRVKRQIKKREKRENQDQRSA